mmetsp:Transcript_30829/g.51237  ORF Transcript_30829/g.51237 Transcript_30829/m.51237 type:complete len:115 (-) Transcript_30829:102-446(-)
MVLANASTTASVPPLGTAAWTMFVETMFVSPKTTVPVRLLSVVPPKATIRIAMRLVAICMAISIASMGGCVIHGLMDTTVPATFAVKNRNEKKKQWDGRTGGFILSCSFSQSFL